MQSIELPIIARSQVDVVDPDADGALFITTASDLGWTVGYFPQHVVFGYGSPEGPVMLTRGDHWDDVVEYRGPGLRVDVLND